MDKDKLIQGIKLIIGKPKSLKCVWFDVVKYCEANGLEYIVNHHDKCINVFYGEFDDIQINNDLSIT